MNTLAGKTYDLIVVGSGVGAMTAALVASEKGQTVAILEKEACFGGSSSRSGGAVWIPCNHLMRRAGAVDSPEEALRYAQSCVNEYSPAATPERIKSYIGTGPSVIEFLEKSGIKLRYIQGYSDYYDTNPGGMASGRALEATMINSRKLGHWAGKINRYQLFAMPVYLGEFADLSNASRHTKGRITALRLAWRMLLQKLRSADIFAQGAALQAQLLMAVLDRDIPVHLDTPVTSINFGNGAVTGVTATHQGKAITLQSKSVLLNTGGFSNNLSLRQAHLPPPQESARFYLGNPGDTGDLIEQLQEAGAAFDQMNEAWWVPSSITPDGFAVSHTLDLSKPHCIMVDSKGERYVNEAMAYMEIGQTMYRHHQTRPSIPSWAIFDSTHRSRYTWALNMPGNFPESWLQSGYIKKADNLDELARLCGLEGDALSQTVTRFNGFAETGKDSDFNRGDRAYERMNGDPTCQPNPTLGAICKPPFYAAPIHVGDVGTCGGLVTNVDAQVMTTANEPINGLYACGNIAANCFGRAYPGPGITLGQSMIFGYRAALHACA